MHSNILLVSVLGAVFAAGAVRGQDLPAVSFEVVTTFDYPQAGVSTQPQKINDRGDIGGILSDTTGSINQGFYRLRNGSFSAPLVEPNDHTGFTQVRGLNNLRTLCGTYQTGHDDDTAGFFLDHGVYTEFAVPGAAFTSVTDLNDANAFVGASTDDTKTQAFISTGGNLTTFAVPGAIDTEALAINNPGAGRRAVFVR